MNILSINNNTILKKTIAQTILVAFLSITTVPVYAQSTLNLPVPGTLVSLSPTYTPAIVAGITVYPENPFQLDFIIDVGDDKLQGEGLKQESQKLINYFMAALTIPEDDMWVNLSPYEKDRIIADGLGDTVLGRDMLAQDYILKQLTASLMYPENKLGNEFWQRVYQKAQEKFGTTDIPTNTFNKIWIVPQVAAIYANGTNIFIADSYLKVMMEEDYLALEHHDQGLNAPVDSGMTEEAKVIVKEVLLPEIEREVNEGENFATLRQIYHSIILATWYKKNLKESLLGKVYVNQNKIDGVDVEDKDIKNKIYNQYLEAFKVGVYDYIKEDYDQVTDDIIPRKYFSGGEAFTSKELDAAMSNVTEFPTKSSLDERELVRVGVRTNLNGAYDAMKTDAAMSAVSALVEEAEKLLEDESFEELEVLLEWGIQTLEGRLRLFKTEKYVTKANDALLERYPNLTDGGVDLYNFQTWGLKLKRIQEAMKEIQRRRPLDSITVKSNIKKEFFAFAERFKRNPANEYRYIAEESDDSLELEYLPEMARLLIRLKRKIKRILSNFGSITYPAMIRFVNDMLADMDMIERSSFERQGIDEFEEFIQNLKEERTQFPRISFKINDRSSLMVFPVGSDIAEFFGYGKGFADIYDEFMDQWSNNQEKGSTEELLKIAAAIIAEVRNDSGAFFEHRVTVKRLTAGSQLELDLRAISPKYARVVMRDINQVYRNNSARSLAVTVNLLKKIKTKKSREILNRLKSDNVLSKKVAGIARFSKKSFDFVRAVEFLDLLDVREELRNLHSLREERTVLRNGIVTRQAVMIILDIDQQHVNDIEESASSVLKGMDDSEFEFVKVLIDPRKKDLIEEERSRVQEVINNNPKKTIFVNASIGGLEAHPELVNDIFDEDFIETLAKQGVIIAVAAGNDDAYNSYAHARYDNLLTVAAGEFDRFGFIKIKKAKYSNYGYGTDFMASGKLKHREGTSFAAPRVLAMLYRVGVELNLTMLDTIRYLHLAGENVNDNWTGEADERFGTFLRWQGNIASKVYWDKKGDNAMIVDTTDEFGKILSAGRGNANNARGVFQAYSENEDQAILKVDHLGGIDFNAGNLNLIDQGQTTNINFINLPNIDSSSVNGITPVIINITPITNLPFLLGQTENGKSRQLSRNFFTRNIFGSDVVL